MSVHCSLPRLLLLPVKTKEQSAILCSCHSCLYLFDVICVAIEQRVRRNIPFGYWIQSLFSRMLLHGCVGIDELLGREYGTRVPRVPSSYSTISTCTHTAIPTHRARRAYGGQSRGIGLKVFFVRTPGARAKKDIKKMNREKRTTNNFIRFFVQH